MLFDAHAHCFPPLGEPGPEEDAERTRWRLAEHQYRVRYHRQGIRRTRDNAPMAEPLLAAAADGASWLPEVGFRVGAHSLLWGSDMPACERTVTYRQSLALFQSQCVDLTDAERAALVGGNLARLYPEP